MRLNGCPAGMISSNEDLIRLMHIKEYIIEPWIMQSQKFDLVESYFVL